MMRSGVSMSLALACYAASAIATDDAIMAGMVADDEACSLGECNAVNLLQHRAVQAVAHERQPAGVMSKVKMPNGPLVDEVYTYGAPATHATPFRNAARADGCFPGLRSYAENIVGARGEIKQIDGGAMFVRMPHAYISSLVLRKPGTDSIYTPCQQGGPHGHPDWPKRGAQTYDEWRVHHEHTYVDRLQKLQLEGKFVGAKDEPFKSADKFRFFAYRAYDNIDDIKRKFAKDMSGWTLVEDTHDKHGEDVDPVLVLQEDRTLDCALVFTGTNALAEFSTSTTSHKTGYCGFTGVHAGYRNELWTLTKNTWVNIRPKLEQCNKVTCVGHSLGGALCEIFAACANSGNTTDPDYQMLAWNKGFPRRMSEATEMHMAAHR